MSSAPVEPGPSLDRNPPQDIDAEKSVLGAMLSSKDAIADCVEAVKGTDMELVSMNDLINRATVHGGTSAPIIDNTIVLRDKTHLTNTFAVRTEKSLEARLRRAGAFGIDGDRAG